MEKKFERNGLVKRVTSMLKVDVRRLFTTYLYYIMVGVAFVVPILVLVMVTMMEGTVSVNPQTGVPSEPLEGFDNVWQIIGAVGGGMMVQSADASANAGGMAGVSMGITDMCNINMMYFAMAVLVCVFVADDFRSGYAKNLFTVRAKKTDYVISKTVVGFIGGASMILAFFIGALIGGGVASLPFTMDGFNAGNLVACLLAKMLLALIFVAIFLLMSVIAKQKLWLSLILSFGVGMFLFMIVPIVSPLNATAVEVILCLVGGMLFAVGLGAISNRVLEKTSLI